MTSPDGWGSFDAAKAIVTQYEWVPEAAGWAPYSVPIGFADPSPEALYEAFTQDPDDLYRVEMGGGR